MEDERASAAAVGDMTRHETGYFGVQQRRQPWMYCCDFKQLVISSGKVLTRASFYQDYEEYADKYGACARCRRTLVGGRCGDPYGEHRNRNFRRMVRPVEGGLADFNKYPAFKMCRYVCLYCVNRARRERKNKKTDRRIIESTKKKVKASLRSMGLKKESVKKGIRQLMSQPQIEVTRILTDDESSMTISSHQTSQPATIGILTMLSPDKNADRYCNYKHRLLRISGLEAGRDSAPIPPLRERPLRADPRRKVSQDFANAVQLSNSERPLLVLTKSDGEIPYKLRRLVISKRRGQMAAKPARIPNARDPRRVRACERASYHSWNIGPPTLVENELIPAEEETCPVLVIDVSDWPVSKSCCIELWPHECNVSRSSLDPQQLDDAGGYVPADDDYLQANGNGRRSTTSTVSLDESIELVEESRACYDANDERPMLGAENDELLVDLVDCGESRPTGSAEARMPREFCDDPDAPLVTFIKEEPTVSRPAPRIDEGEVDLVDLCDSDDEGSSAPVPKTEPVDEEIVKREQLREEVEVLTLYSDDDDDDVVFCSEEPTSVSSQSTTVPRCGSATAAGNSCRFSVSYYGQEPLTGSHVLESAEPRTARTEKTTTEPPSAIVEKNAEAAARVEENHEAERSLEKIAEPIAAENQQVVSEAAFQQCEQVNETLRESRDKAIAAELPSTIEVETTTGAEKRVEENPISPDDDRLFFIDTLGAYAHEIHDTAPRETATTEPFGIEAPIEEEARDKERSIRAATSSTVESVCSVKNSNSEASGGRKEPATDASTDNELRIYEASAEVEAPAAEPSPDNETQSSAANHQVEAPAASPSPDNDPRSSAANQEVEAPAADESALWNNAIISTIYNNFAGEQQRALIASSNSKKRHWFADENTAPAFVSVVFKKHKQTPPENELVLAPIDNLERSTSRALEKRSWRLSQSRLAPYERDLSKVDEMRQCDEQLRRMNPWKLYEQYVRNFKFSWSCFLYFLKNYKDVPLYELFKVSEHVQRNENFWRDRNNHWHKKESCISIEDVTGTESCDLGKTTMDKKSRLLSINDKNQNLQQNINQLDEIRSTQSLHLSSYSLCKPVIGSAISKIKQDLKENYSYSTIISSSNDKLNDIDKYRKRNSLPGTINFQNNNCVKRPRSQSSDLKLTIKRDHFNQNNWIASKSNITESCDTKNKISEFNIYKDKEVPELEINDFEKPPTIVNREKLVKGLGISLKRRLKNYSSDEVVSLVSEYSNKRIRLSSECTDREMPENISFKLSLDHESLLENNLELVGLRKSFNDEKPKTHLNSLRYDPLNNINNHKTNNYNRELASNMSLTSNKTSPKICTEYSERLNKINFTEQCCSSTIHIDLNTTDNNTSDDDSVPALSIEVSEIATDSELQSDHDVHIDHNSNIQKNLNEVDKVTEKSLENRDTTDMLKKDEIKMLRHKKRCIELFGPSDSEDSIQEVNINKKSSSTELDETILTDNRKKKSKNFLSEKLFKHEQILEKSNKNSLEVYTNSQLESYNIKSKNSELKSCKESSLNITIETIESEDEEIRKTNDENSKEIEENHLNNSKTIEENSAIAAENESCTIGNNELEKDTRIILDTIQNEFEKCKKDIDIQNNELKKYGENIAYISQNSELEKCEKNVDKVSSIDAENNGNAINSVENLTSNNSELNTHIDNGNNTSEETAIYTECEKRNATSIILEISNSSKTIETNCADYKEDSSIKEQIQQNQSTENPSNISEINNYATTDAPVNENQMLPGCIIETDYHLEGGDFELLHSLPNREYDYDGRESGDYTDYESPNLNEYSSGEETENFVASRQNSFKDTHETVKFEKNNDSSKIAEPLINTQSHSLENLPKFYDGCVTNIITNTDILDSLGSICVNNSDDEVIFIEAVISNSTINESNNVKIEKLRTIEVVNVDLDVEETNNYLNTVELNERQNKTGCSSDLSEINVESSLLEFKSKNSNCVQNTNLRGVNLSVNESSDKAIDNLSSQNELALLNTNLNEETSSEYSVHSGNLSRDSSPDLVIDESFVNNDNSLEDSSNPVESCISNVSVSVKNKSEVTIDNEAVAPQWSKRNARKDLYNPKILKEFNLTKEVFAPEEVKNEISTEIENNDQQIVNNFFNAINKEIDCSSRVPSQRELEISTETCSSKFFKHFNLVMVNEYDEINVETIDSVLNESCNVNSNEINNTTRNEASIIGNDISNNVSTEANDTVGHEASNSSVNNEIRYIRVKSMDKLLANPEEHQAVPLSPESSPNCVTTFAVSTNLESNQNLAEGNTLENLPTSSGSPPNIVSAKNTFSQPIQESNNSNINEAAHSINSAQNYIIIQQTKQPLHNTEISTSNSELRSTSIPVIISQNTRAIPGSESQFSRSSTSVNTNGTRVVCASDVNEISAMFAHIPSNPPVTVENTLNVPTVYNLPLRLDNVILPAPLTITPQDSEIDRKVFEYKTMLLKKIYANLKVLGRLQSEKILKHVNTILNFLVYSKSTTRFLWIIITIIRCIIIFIKLTNVRDGQVVVAVQNSVNKLKKDLNEERLHFCRVDIATKIFKTIKHVIPMDTLKRQPIFEELIDGNQTMTDEQKSTFNQQVIEYKRSLIQLNQHLVTFNQHNNQYGIQINSTKAVVHQNVTVNSMTSTSQMISLQQLASRSMEVSATSSASNRPNQSDSQNTLPILSSNQIEVVEISEEDSNICLKCKKKSSITCSVCKAATYCSRDCQLNHWKEEHYKSCKHK